MKEKPFASENSFNYFGLIMKNAVYPLTFRMKFFLTHKLMARAYISPAQNRILFRISSGRNRIFYEAETSNAIYAIITSQM